MKTTFILLLILAVSINAFSQGKGDYRVESKLLDTGVYNPEKVAKNSFKVFLDEEADQEFDKILSKDPELRKLYVSDVIDGEGPITSIREQEIYKYYPELGIILETGGHGYPSAFDIKNKKDVCGDPATYAYSPSGRYRLSGLDVDGMYYYLEEKVNNEYICLGRVYFDGIISGYYWVDEETIYYLDEQQEDEGPIQRVAYSGRFVIIDWIL